MGRRINKVKVFVKEHAEDIGYVLGIAAVCGCGLAVYGITKKRASLVTSTPVTSTPFKGRHLDIPEKLAEFGVTVFDDYPTGVEVMADEYTATVSDLGKFGETLCGFVDDISPESKVFVLMHALKEAKED